MADFIGGNGIKFDSNKYFSLKLSLKQEDIAKLPVDNYGNVLLEVKESKPEHQTVKGATKYYIVKDDYAYSKLGEAKTGGKQASADPF
jgi:hypothetical protein